MNFKDKKFNKNYQNNIVYKSKKYRYNRHSL